MKSLLKTTILLLSIFSLSLHARGQSNFAGNWTRTNQEFLTGAFYGNATETAVSIVVEGDQWKISRTSFMGPGKPDTTTIETVKPDGAAAKFKKDDGRYRLTTLKRIGDKAFTETFENSVPNDETKKDYEFKEEWTLNDDGTLTIIRSYASVTDPSANYSAKGTYTRQ